MLDKLLGGESKPFLVLSEESNTDLVIAPTRPEEPEADEASAASEAPILFAQGVAPAQPAAAKAKPAALKAQQACHCQAAIVPKLEPRARAGGYLYLLLSAVRMGHRKPCHWQNSSLGSICQAST